jgi:hypothetical protein
MFRRIATNTFASILALGLFAAPSVASADEDDTAGIAWDLQVLTTSADTYLQYHGRLIVMVGTTPAEYRWGGATCGSRTMSDDNIRALKEAVAQGLTITPRFQLGQGDLKCLVGFAAEKIALSGGGGGGGPN